MNIFTKKVIGEGKKIYGLENNNDVQPEEYFLEVQVQ